MEWNETKAQAAIDAFAVETDTLRQTALVFRREIEAGLAGGDSSLRLLPSFLGLPRGTEAGEYLALDFGGTNARAARVRLTPPGRFEILGRAAWPLRGDGYDFTGPRATASGLFGFLAGLIAQVTDGDRQTPFLLGHTFSFPSEQTALADARLIQWTKEFSVPGVEGKMVNALLEEALREKGFGNIRTAAVINDTVAVLLAAAYRYGDTWLGSIYATGHNTCYLEEYGGQRPAMVLNMESGGFSHLTPNEFDRRLDERSEKPGAQRLEKMVSGRYLGELFSLALTGITGRSVPAAAGADLSAVIAGDDGITCLTRLLGEEPDAAAQQSARRLAAAIARRSARLVAATFAGTLRHHADSRPKNNPPDGHAPQHIAIEGSLYHYMPLLQRELRETLSDLLDSAAVPDVVPVDNGSILGAAIAAAMSDENSG